MKKDLTKMFSKEISNLHKEMTNQIKTISKMIKTDVNSQIAEVLQTMQALNQRFNDVMDHLPTTTTPTTAHKKPKGLGRQLMCIRTASAQSPFGDKTNSLSNDNIDINDETTSITTNNSAHQGNPHHPDPIPDNIQIPEIPPPPRN